MSSKKLESEPIRRGRKSDGHKSYKSVGFAEDQELSNHEDEVLANAKDTDRAGRSPRKRFNFQMAEKLPMCQKNKRSSARHLSTDARTPDRRGTQKKRQPTANQTESDDDCPRNISESEEDYSHDYEEQDKLEDEVHKRMDNNAYVQLKPKEVFRVPLTWMMLDSCVDMYLLKEDKLASFDYLTSAMDEESGDGTDPEAVLLVSDIATKYNKSASHVSLDAFCEGIVSKVHELNDDLYVCYDIQGYSCKPETTKHSNPIQYVVSLNPPLMLTNYCMAPLDIYEIDDPHNERLATRKRTAQIAPAMSCYLFQLDLSKDNESDILFRFHDTQNKALNNEERPMLSHLFAQFDLRKEQTKNEANINNESSCKRVYFKRHNSEEEFKSNVDARGKKLELCQMTIETVKKIYNKEVEGYSENFGQRERLIDVSIAIKKMIYPDYMVVNKTEKLISYHGVAVDPRCNDFLMTSPEDQELTRQEGEKVRKLKFGVEEFTSTDSFEICNTGASFQK